MKVIESGTATAKKNMDDDRLYLKEIAEMKVPTLRFYEWERDSATYGYFITPPKWVYETGVDLAKRPTGGGVLFHGHDITFSFFLPSHHAAYSMNTLENYFCINERVFEALVFMGFSDLSLQREVKTSTSFCMKEPTIYDIMREGKKIAGGAIRRVANGLLYQGAINLFPFKYHFGQSTYLFKREDPILRKELKTYLIESFLKLS